MQQLKAFFEAIRGAFARFVATLEESERRKWEFIRKNPDLVSCLLHHDYTSW